MRKALFVIMLFCLPVIATGQKNVSGLQFSACVNNDKLAKNFYNNKFLVLDFWATWCGPCIGSFPRLNELEEKYKDNKKVVFATITGESKGKIDTFFARKKNPLPHSLHLIDDNGATWTYFNISVIPEILVFSPEGKIVFEGRVEQLAPIMDDLLKGVVAKTEVKKEKDPGEWKKYREQALFIALTGPADTAEKENGNTAKNKDKVSFNYRNMALSDVISGFGDITVTKIASNDSVKLKQRINLHYKQLKDQYPEFNKGAFEQQYQNHILHLLERTFSFRAGWTTEKTTAYKIVVKDAELLERSSTISTKGSYSSTLDEQLHKYNFVNQQLSTFAEYAEDALGIFVYTDVAARDKGYDVVLECSSLPEFMKSLRLYGLAIEQVENYEVKKLKLTFD